jgi:hypothetical protein
MGGRGCIKIEIKSDEIFFIQENFLIFRKFKKKFSKSFKFQKIKYFSNLF